MGTPAAVLGDKIMGTCANHLMPGPSGTQPAGPQLFSAPLTQGLATSVLIGGKPAAVQGSSGYNVPPHAGIVDPPFASPTSQEGKVLMGSTTVMFEGKPAAKTGSKVLMCVAPGQLIGSASNVLIGG